MPGAGSGSPRIWLARRSRLDTDQLTPSHSRPRSSTTVLAAVRSAFALSAVAAAACLPTLPPSSTPFLPPVEEIPPLIALPLYNEPAHYNEHRLAPHTYENDMQKWYFICCFFCSSSSVIQ